MREPRDARDLAQIIADAGANGTRLELRGGGTKADFGAPREAEVVSLAALTGAPGFYTLELRAKALELALGTCLAAKVGK